MPWTAVKHPDFPNHQVEVGGIKPFVMVNPPYEKVGEIAKQHTDFILKLAGMQPKLEFHKLKTEAIGNGLTRVTVDLFNNSPLPTHSEMGTRSRWLRKLRVDIDVPAAQLVSGDKMKLITSLGAFEKTTMSWLVRSKGPLTLKAGAPHAGFVSQTVKF